MRLLHPSYDEAADLEELYAYPSDPRPYLRANMVSSVDGASNLEGRSPGLSGRADKRIFHLLRGLADVILVGAGTVRVERYSAMRPRPEWEPLRNTAGRPPAPHVAVVSRRLDLDLSIPLFAAAPPDARVIVLTAASASAERRRAIERIADVVVAGEEWVDLGRAVDELAARGHPRVLCEGGPQLLAQIAARGRLDDLCLSVTPLLTAGDAPRVLNGVPLAEPSRLHLAHVLEEEGHLFLRYTVPREG